MFHKDVVTSQPITKERFQTTKFSNHNKMKEQVSGPN